MDEARIQHAAYRLAVKRGLVAEHETTSPIRESGRMETLVHIGALDADSALHLEAEAALLLDSHPDAGEETTLMGLFPLKETDRYQPELFLGDGGMGRVFRAYDMKLRRKVALKFFRTSLPREAKLFQREAQSQARIDHPHVARVFEAGELEGIPYLSMQYIHGPTLAQARPDLGLEEKVELVRQACLGVHAAHRLGIVHRDLKPGNIMLEKNEQGRWQALVMDFGLARDISDPQVFPSTTVMGTPAFMAPEQVMGPAVLVGPHTDVYALGVTLYHLACGRLPFPGSTHVELFRQVVEEEPLPLRIHDPSIPQDLEAIIQRCMEKDLLKRYDTALDLAEDLQRYLDRVPVVARPVGPWRRLGRRLRRNPAALVGLGATLLLAGGWAAYAVYTRTQEQAIRRLVTAQGQDLARIRGELDHLRKAQDTERQRAEALQRLVDLAQTPNERREAEARLKQSQERAKALSEQVNRAERLLPAMAPAAAPLPRPDRPAEESPKPAPGLPAERAASRTEGEFSAVTPPQILRKEPPQYPRMAKANPTNPYLARDMAVVVQVQVDAGGQVQGVAVLEGVPGAWGYNEAAVAAMRASTFAPAQQNGRPVDGTLVVKVTFRKIQ